MIFAPDTEVALATVVDLINTVAMDTDGLLTLADLDRFVTEQRFFGSRTHSDAELRSVRQLRTQLRDIWVAPEDEAVEQVNFILRNARALPQLVKHDGLDYHIHATTQQAPLSERMAVEAAMALVDVIRSGSVTGCAPVRHRIAPPCSWIYRRTAPSSTAIPATARTANTSVRTANANPHKNCNPRHTLVS